MIAYCCVFLPYIGMLSVPSNLEGVGHFMLTSIIKKYVNVLQDEIHRAEHLMSSRNSELRLALRNISDVVEKYGHLETDYIRCAGVRYSVTNTKRQQEVAAAAS